MKKIAIISGLAACALVFTACGGYKGSSSDGADLPKEYKAFLDYTFNRHYSVEEIETTPQRAADGEYRYRQWDISYKTKSGKKRTAELYSDILSDISNIYGYKDQHTADVGKVNDMVGAEIEEVIKEDFVELMSAKYSDVDFNGTDGGLRCTCAFSPVTVWADPNDISTAESFIDPKNGYKLADMSLKSLGKNSDLVGIIIFRLKPEADMVESLATVYAIEQTLMEEIGTPQNLEIKVMQQSAGSDTKRENLYSKYYVMGEEYTPENESDFIFGKYVTEKVLAAKK